MDNGPFIITTIGDIRRNLRKPDHCSVLMPEIISIDEALDFAYILYLYIFSYT